MDGWLELRHGGRARMVPLSAEVLTVGRAATNGVVIDDAEVSRLHAVIERFPAGWSIRDLGSTNGTTVNGEALHRTRSLHDGDRIAIGPALVIMRSPGDRPATATHRTAAPEPPPRLTPREQDVVDVLCRPAAGGGGAFVQPPTVRQLARALGLGESAVKKHLTNLYDKFGLVTNEQRRRAALAAEAVRRGVFRVPPGPDLGH